MDDKKEDRELINFGRREGGDEQELQREKTKTKTKERWRSGTRGVEVLIKTKQVVRPPVERSTHRDKQDVGWIRAG